MKGNPDAGAVPATSPLSPSPPHLCGKEKEVSMVERNGINGPERSPVSPAPPCPPLSLAPLRGVTLCDFRRTLGEQFRGVDWALTPFIALGAPGRVKPALLSDLLPENNGPIPTIPQIIGKDPAALRDMIRALRDLGYTHVNLNCGCPWKFVAKKGRGSGLPENPDAFERMLEAGCTELPDGFSIKIRLGYATTETLAARIPLINRYPLRAVIIHPRTGVQMYDGMVDLDAFARVLPAFRAPVIYNGDIFTPDDALRLLQRFPTVQGLMLGRGLCRNPALAEEIVAAAAAGTSAAPCRDATFRERVAAFARTLEARYEAKLFGPAPLMGRLKELWGYLHATFETGDAGLRRIQRARTLPEMREAIRALIGGAS